MEWFENVRKSESKEQLYGLILRTMERLGEMLDEHYDFVEKEVQKLISSGMHEHLARQLADVLTEESEKKILQAIEDNKKNLEKIVSTQIIEE
tara:strand:+ start:2529 stop:2807 length:279 start_codon:yes stop_codon:yes gene_type:complete